MTLDVKEAGGGVDDATDLLWFLFHGSGISDGTPPSPFVAHWALAAPHVALFLLAALLLRLILRQYSARASR